MINKNRFGVANDKKLLRKIGKQWVTVSALTLVLLGGGAVASSIVTHADTTTPVVEAQGTNNIKEQLNSNLDEAYQASQSASSNVSSPKASSASANSVNMPSNIESQATDMYRGLMLNAVNNSNSTATSSVSTKSSVASNGSTSSKPSFNSAYQSYMAKMSGTDNEVASTHDNDVENNNNPISKIQSTNNKKVLVGATDNSQTTMSDGHWITNYTTNDEDQTISNGKFYSDNDIHDWQNSTSDYDGLSYRYSPSMKAVEFTGGTMSNSFQLESDLPYSINGALSIKFDSDVQTKINNTYYQGPSLSRDSNLISADLDLNTSNIQNMSSFLSNNPQLQFIRFGNKVNTHNVTNMSYMFYDDGQLQSVDLSNLDTSNVTNMSYMFCSDISLNTIIFGNKFTTNKVNNMSDMFATSYEDGRSIFSDIGVGNIHISSPDTKFNSTAMISAPNDFGQQNLWQKYSNYTNTAALGKALNNGPVTTNLDDGKSHVGDWRIINPAYVTIHFMGGYNSSDNVGSDKMIVQNSQEVTISTPVGTHFLNVGDNEGNDDRTFVENSDKALVKCEPDTGTNNLDIYMDVAPNQATDMIDYQLNGTTRGSQQFTGNDYRAVGANNTILDVTNSNDHGSDGQGIPNGYQLVNPDNKFNYDGDTHDVAIKPVPSYVNVIEYIDNNGSDVGDTSAYGQEGTNVPNKVIEDDVPRNYQLSPNQVLPVQITKNNVVKVAVKSDNGKGDMVVGTAYLTLLYKKGTRTDGQVLRLHINGNIGDSPIVINPQDYDRDGYSVASSDNVWQIPFDYKDVKHATNDFSRYNVENTFTYQAYQIPIDITYFDTQTNHKLSSDNLGKIAYDGDTADLQGTDDNNVLSVDGKEYHLNLPTGYHLAHMNNYIKITANGTYVKPVTTVGGIRMLRMPLMKLTLGITPHFRKPASSSSVAPKPSSASSVTPQPASSASTEPSSASVVPSSASQSVASSTSTASNTIVPSSTAPVTPSVASSSVTSTKASSSATSASVSMKPSSTNISPVSAIARPVAHHANHKHVIKKHAIKSVTHRISNKKMAKHDTKRLNHQVAKATEQLNTVERHMEAGKATHAKRIIKHAKKRLHYLRRNKRHVAHALRRITRNKVAIKRAKEQIASIKRSRTFYIKVDRIVLVHTEPSAIGHLRAYYGVIKPWQLRTYLVTGMSKGRYVIKYRGHRGYITVNHDYVRNAYYQHYDLRNGRKSHVIRVVHNCCEYRNEHFGRQTYVRGLHRGMTLKIRRIVTIAKHHMTRFQMTNGHWVTANKNFVRLIK